MSKAITASVLYNLVQCPKRVELDYFGDTSQRDESNPFIQMLWEKGTLYEQEVIDAGGFEFSDLSVYEGQEKLDKTLEAMRKGEALIYNGRIAYGDLLGVPDFLRKNGNGYVPLDIKSGVGLKHYGDDIDGKPKLSYAVQLALYVNILEEMGLSAGRYGYILDINGEETQYDLMAPQGPRKPTSLWDEYQKALATARAILEKEIQTGALASSCKLCYWYSKCSKDLKEARDLTLIPHLGRSLRDTMVDRISTIDELAAINPDAFIIKKKTIFPGLSPDRLKIFHARAKLLVDSNAGPYLRETVTLPRSNVEFFFDIEVDPMRDFTYLHGIVERRDGDSDNERFAAFFTDDETPEAEKKAFADSVAFLNSVPEATIWYYSKYERTIYRKLQQRYPDVCSADDIEELFNPKRAIDLYYDVVFRATEWPTNDHSIKTLADYLGFKWRDNNPSGAASIEWFDNWVRERDPVIKNRILEYNEDDCRATRVLLDGIRALS